jgi:hypothetical protein
MELIRALSLSQLVQALLYSLLCTCPKSHRDEWIAAQEFISHYKPSQRHPNWGIFSSPTGVGLG